jgi:putative spermidine/putrescine transport system ATP-binding protein
LTTGTGLHIDEVSKHYGQTVALDRAQLHVADGELVTLLGPSGSGKTTLLRIVAGFETPSGGEVRLQGREISRLSPAERGVGMVFQQYALFPHMTAAENIAYGLKVRRWPGAKREKRVAELLELVGLAERSDHRPRELSGGQQQRVALARAIAYEPEVLLMDEPLGALDRTLRIEMEEEIRRIHRDQGTTIVYVTHDKQEALALSDRIAIMNEAKLVALGDPEELYYRPSTAFVARFFAGANAVPVESIGANGSGTARVRLAGSECEVPMPNRIEGEGRLVIRPRCFSREADGGVRLSGVLRESLLFGEEREIHLEIDGIGKINALLDARASHDLELGAELSLYFRPEEALLVPA